jgi:tetratricopeptide (TPR) repeat protein
LKLPLQVTLAVLVIALTYGLVSLVDMPAKYNDGGDAWREQNQFGMAERAYLLVLEYDPDDLAARYGLAVTKLRTGDRDAALALLDDLDEDERRADVDLTLGWLDYNSGDYEAARLRFESAMGAVTTTHAEIYEDSDRAYAIASLGWSLMMLDGCEPARALFEQAAGFDAALELVVQGRGVCR